MLKFEDLYKHTKEPDVKLDNAGNLDVYEKDPIKQFLLCISEGTTFNNACGYAKLLPKEVKKWLAQGEDDANNNLDTNYSDLFFRYNRAKAIFEINNLKAIKEQIANGSWSAASFLLERRLPESYSSKQEVKVGSENLQINIDIPKA